MWDSMPEILEEKAALGAVKMLYDDIGCMVTLFFIFHYTVHLQV